MALENLKMQNEKIPGNIETAKLACVDCSCDHRVAINMSKPGTFNPCGICLTYRNVYEIVR